jgi:hypothetical protein
MYVSYAIACVSVCVCVCMCGHVLKKPVRDCQIMTYFVDLSCFTSPQTCI